MSNLLRSGTVVAVGAADTVAVASADEHAAVSSANSPMIKIPSIVLRPVRFIQFPQIFIVRRQCEVFFAMPTLSDNLVR